MSNLGYIYSIISRNEGTVYIGSTIQIRVKNRWNFHKRELHNNKHSNDKLTELFIKYGLEDLVFTCEQVIEFEDYQELIDIEGIEIRHIPEDWCLNIGRHPEKGSGMAGRNHNLESINKMSKIKQGRNNPMYGRKHTEASKGKNRQSNIGLQAGVNNPMYRVIMCSKEYLYKSPGNKYYFVIALNQFCANYDLTATLMSRLAAGKRKHHKGWSGGYAEQWMIDKVKPLLKPGQYWVEIDIEGNILQSMKED